MLQIRTTCRSNDRVMQTVCGLASFVTRQETRAELWGLLADLLNAEIEFLNKARDANVK